MAVIKHPFISTQQPAPTIEDFDKAIHALPTDSDDARLYTDIMKAISLGLLSPNKQQMEAIRLLFSKKVPDAPKDFNIRNKTSVEVVIKNFLEDNPFNFSNILDMAKDITEKELVITNAIQE